MAVKFSEALSEFRQSVNAQTLPQRAPQHCAIERQEPNGSRGPKAPDGFGPMLRLDVVRTAL